MSNPTCSLVIATYNWPSALQKCLESVFRQTILPNEIIIGDDGSEEETTLMIEKISAQSPVPVKHIWQKDEGFQLAKIRNKTFAAASYEYIIQIDSDLILHPNFIADHLRFSKKNTFVCGARSLLNEAYSKEILSSTNIPVFSSSDKRIDKRYNCYRNLFLSCLQYLFQRGKNNTKYVLGCNMAFWKTDIVKVNGYNELFKGWGKEDNDLAIRLTNAGVGIRVLKFAGIIYHIYHKEASRNNLQENELLLQQTIDKKIIESPSGIKNYL